MFTGLIEETGQVLHIEEREEGRAIRVAADCVLDGVALGDSISLNGACHTVTSFDGESFEVFSAAMTLDRTNVGDWAVGTRVNLERAMQIGDRLGGHMVQGHVDGTGEVVAVQPLEGRVLIDFTSPDLVMEVTILHGSITVDGISLTVNALPAENRVQVSIIPHTWQVTNLSDRRPGDRINLEGDLIGKYVRGFLGPARGSEQGAHVRRRWGYQP